MRPESVAILALADAIPNYSREHLLQDVEKLIASKRYYTCEDLAIRYDVTVQTIKNWHRDGRLVPDLRVGTGTVRYSAAAVAGFECTSNHPENGEAMDRKK